MTSLRFVSSASVLSVLALSMPVLAGCPSDRVCDTGATQVCVCPSLAMGAQSCTAEGVWGACMCGDPQPDAGMPVDTGGTDAGGVEVDAGMMTDAPVSVDAPPPACIPFDDTVFTMTTVESDGALPDTVLYLTRFNADMSLVFRHEVYYALGATEGAQTVSLTGDLATCPHCLTMTECAGPCMGTEGTLFLASEGTIAYSALTATSMSAVLTNVRLIEVTIDPTTFEATPVPGGRSFCAEHLEYSGMAPPPG